MTDSSCQDCRDAGIGRLTLPLILVCVTSTSLWAEHELPPSPALPQRLSVVEGLTNPLTGEVLTTLEPLHGDEEKQKRKAKALARYMAGRIAMERRRVPAAIEAFKKAIEIDPEAVDSYQALVPLLLTQQRMEEAEDYVLQAARKTDNGYELVLVMASVYVRQTKIDQGIELMKRALGTRSIQPGSREDLLVHRDLGLYHRLNNDFEQASQEYQIVFERLVGGELNEELLAEVLKEPGKNFDEFGDTFLKAGHPELALKAYEEASKYREAKPGLHSFNLATVFKQTDQPEKALAALQEYFDAKLQSRGRAPYVLLEELLTTLGRENEVQSKLEELLKNDDGNEVLRYYVADKMLALGNFERAERLYLHGAESVSDPRALVGMLAIYHQQANYPKLLDVLTKAFQVIPRGDDSETLKRLEEDLRTLSEGFETQLTSLKEDKETMNGLYSYARTLKEGDEPSLEFVQAYLLGKLATEADDTDAALDFYKFAISMRNDPPALLYTEIGGHLLDAEHYEQAVEILTEAAAHPSSGLQSEKWRFLFFLSYGHEFLGETEKALSVIEEALNSAPNAIHGRLEYQKAWIFYHARNWEAALAQFNEVIDAYASDADLVQDSKFRMSNIYVEMGDMTQGESVLEEILKDDPANIQANNDLGYLWADQGKNLAQAHEMVQKALTAEPENPAYLDSMGWVLFKQGDYEQAVTYLQKATETKNGDDSTIFEHLGDALQKSGKAEAAQAAYRKALDLEQAKKRPSEKLLKSIQGKLKEEASEAS